uniref:MAS-related GPR, member B1 n=1 Tax=Mus musculus TaxID=10090 RepID=A0A087WR15_MOUSE
MEQRTEIAPLLKMDLVIQDWTINITALKESNDNGISFCEVVSRTMTFLSLIIALVGLVGNATVLWFLGFQMSRNAFSVYILNLAGTIGFNGRLSSFFCREPCKTLLRRKNVERWVPQEDLEK